ncbi:helix-turn-helix domain-containing protein [Streptomyces sp. NPDC056161]|uniref:helix-turn-helix domain-containing protein n=1 Tax=Streptomyces sp. NPDC056161 TaxID=3345732 RepID=UPI0035DDD8CE
MSRIYDLYPRDLLDNKQAAEYAGVGPSTIRQWVHRGLLEPALPGKGRGERTLYNRPDLDEVKRKLAAAEAERQAAWAAYEPGKPPPLPAGARAA